MWRQVKLKEKRNVIEFDLKKVSAKKHKETNRLVFRLKALFSLKNIFCFYFSPIVKLWPRKKVIFKVFVFWRYSKTLSKFKWFSDDFRGLTCLNLIEEVKFGDNPQDKGDWLRNLVNYIAFCQKGTLIHFKLMFHFYNPWIYTILESFLKLVLDRKTKVSLLFLGGEG